MNLIIVVLFLFTSISVSANSSYSFLSGGYQLTSVAKDGMGQHFDNKYHYNAYKKLHGVYFRGSWNFVNNFFAEYRTGSTIRSSSKLVQDYFSMGYYIPLSTQTNYYTSVGYASYDTDREINIDSGNVENKKTCKNRKFKEDKIGLSAEIGLRFNAINGLQIEPSYRYTDFSKKGQHELRLTNLIELSQNSDLELNAEYRHWKELDESNYQMGYRYSF
ncbi:outer membrane beta-barrel protein [Photobacterium frigidiphilum]|uniref:outer membrane beta-barrel protein n=1 Tax=Photobacterium frigidiphilum TaxID=264736 RepID=UPI001D130C90|nr:outer membrane beta-barrel protein [Photobacterium frigidiphilum]